MNHIELSKKLGLEFRNPDLLRQALTHRSFLNENRQWPTGNNERLEFLGDAVLELVVTDFLFASFPKLQEGALTAARSKLVSGDALSEIAEHLGLHEYVYMSRGQRYETKVVRVRERILACAFEAVVGALYLDQGYEAVDSFVKQVLLPSLSKVMARSADSKSLLQEKAQSSVGTTPTYQILEATGPDHDKHFVIGVFFGSTLVAKGHGPSKKSAEEKAAEAALVIRGWNAA